MTKSDVSSADEGYFMKKIYKKKSAKKNYMKNFWLFMSNEKNRRVNKQALVLLWLQFHSLLE